MFLVKFRIFFLAILLSFAAPVVGVRSRKSQGPFDTL